MRITAARSAIGMDFESEFPREVREKIVDKFRHERVILW
jgi:hypothetical protein